MPESALNRRAAIAAILMAATAVGGQAMVPTRKMAQMRGDFNLQKLVPENFGNWHVDQRASGIVNPEAEVLLDKIYSQQLNRVYLDDQGRRIMLSIAYGEDQADDSVQLHYPEVCYPAQGFRVRASRKDVIRLPAGRSIRVRRLETSLTDTRFEPVTYWTIIGDEQSLGGWDRKVLEIRHGLKGEIVDGLLFRVSSLDRNPDEGFAAQDQFIRDIVAAMTPKAQRELAGLG